jgi:hypothetical protein
MGRTARYDINILFAGLAWILTELFSFTRVHRDNSLTKYCHSILSMHVFPVPLSSFCNKKNQFYIVLVDFCCYKLEFYQERHSIAKKQR